MAKLHELLAVQDNLRGQAEATRADLRNTFEKKQNHFWKRIQTFTPYAEGAQMVVEGQQEMQTTVEKELKWIGELLGKAIDNANQIDVANTTARADVLLDDGTPLLVNVPATSLLQLEKRIKEIHELVAVIPTLDPAKNFEQDEDAGADGVRYRARPKTQERTEKQFDYVVMVAPTDKHPAQVKELMRDKAIGLIELKEWCSFITVTQKGEMLERVEEVMRAVKKARARANEIDVDTKSNRIAGRILNYVFKGKAA